MRIFLGGMVYEQSDDWFLGSGFSSYTEHAVSYLRKILQEERGSEEGKRAFAKLKHNLKKAVLQVSICL